MSRMDHRKPARRVRRRFSDEFKDQTVRLVLDEGKTVNAVARELNLVPSAVGVWVKHALADRTQGKTGLTKEEREELARLRKENRELRMERDEQEKRDDEDRADQRETAPGGRKFVSQSVA